MAPSLHNAVAMIQRLGAFLLLSSFLGVGCGVGDDSGDIPICADAFKVTGTFTPGTPARPATDPTPDETGAYPPFTGCWPFGTWNFTVAIDPSEDAIQDFNNDKVPDRCGTVSGTSIATFESSYSFTVTRMDDAKDDFIDTYTLAGTTQDGERTFFNDKILYKLKVTEGGSAECEGGLELYSKDGKSFWNLHPTQGGTTIGGTGDFFLYKSSQLKD
jgi:hypothetical protein